MDLDERRKYDEMLNTLRTTGWRFIQDRLQEAYDSQDKILGMDTWDNVCRAQGRLITLFQIINLDEVLRQELTEADATEEDDGLSTLEK